ncbi:hypothetical protein EXU85_00505 [Spirosoma sp. KCTC 42546]|uniref:hypothetical protein n=1 Tax=Spirosoma sp. KCTC 42546 TaxID=2520506 RepID=UPI001157B098|nr:hypothetical protein [Spirosoma sp. KCTC 42546]QDK77154.1 hypothetical protein EXU85_00505 [Spirosoma sp. KCTC 42546]
MLQIEGIPNYRKLDKHLWADYAEFKCMLSKDKEYTGADLADNLFTAIKDLNVEFDSFNDEQNIIDVPLLKDNEELFINDIFSVINYRSAAYASSYPFYVENKKIKQKKILNQLHRLYLYLLLCSHLRFIPQTNWAVLTGDFEYISSLALKKCLPERAIIKIFGTTKSGGPPQYVGTTFNKIKQLAADLNEVLLANKDDFAPTASKDKGIDLVAWIPFKDKQNSRLICFGQCKCSDQWPAMRFSSSLAQWNNWIHFNNHLNNFAFIPYCYRKTGGSWFDKSSIGDTIVVDRQRIIELIESLGKTFKFSSLSSDKFLSQLLDTSKSATV